MALSWFLWPYVYIGECGQEMAPASSSFPGGVSQGSLPLQDTSEMSKLLFLLYASGIFQTAASVLYPQGLLCYVLKAGTQYPFTLQALPELNLPIFFFFSLIPGFKSHWL